MFGNVLLVVSLCIIIIIIIIIITMLHFNMEHCILRKAVQ